MASKITKRSIAIGDRKTSVSLEDDFWDSLLEMARDSGLTVSKLVRKIDEQRHDTNLSSAIRLAVFAHFDRRRDA